MSFLSYLSHPVLVVASVGGVTLGVALLLFPPWKTVSSRSFYHTPFFSSSQIRSLSHKTQIEKENNCKVISGLENVINRISNSLDYISISCENTGIGSDEILDNKWVALFHKNLFKKVSNKFNMKTTTEIQYEGDKYEGNMSFKTTFKSEEFIKEEIIGKWKYGKWYIDEKTVDHIEIEEPYSLEKIYFVYGHNKR